MHKTLIYLFWGLHALLIIHIIMQPFYRLFKLFSRLCKLFVFNVDFFWIKFYMEARKIGSGQIQRIHESAGGFFFLGFGFCAIEAFRCCGSLWESTFCLILRLDELFPRYLDISKTANPIAKLSQMSTPESCWIIWKLQWHEIQICNKKNSPAAWILWTQIHIKINIYHENSEKFRKVLYGKTLHGEDNMNSGA